MLGFHPDCDPGWRAVGVDVVLGRTAIHVACGIDDFWIDDETKLVLRHEEHPADELHLATGISEVVKLQFMEQPADLFELPPGATIGLP